MANSNRSDWDVTGLSTLVLAIGFMGTLGFTGCSVKQGSIPMPGAPLPETVPGENLIAKHPSHTNYVQCGDAQLEVLLNVTGSDLESQVLNNSPVSVRELAAGPAYSSVTTNAITEVIWGTMEDPEMRGFQLGTQAGMSILVMTHDFRSGQGLYNAGANQPTRVMSCTFSNGDVPAPLAAGTPTPAPIPVPAPRPNPDGGIPATGAADAAYLQCKGTVLEVYTDFSRVDRAGWTHVGNARYGVRAADQTAAPFRFYGNSMSSSYEMGGTSYASYNASNDAGDQFDLSLSTSDFVAASVKAAMKTNGQRTEDRITCQWLQNHIYAGQFGW